MKQRPVLLLLLLAAPAWADEPSRFTFEEPHMGTKFRIVLYAPDRGAAEKAAKEAFARAASLNRIMSDYDPASELMQLCKKNASQAGEPVRVSEDLFVVLSKAQKVSEASDGTFDVTVGPLVKLWRLARRTQSLPDPAELAEAKARVGFRKLELNDKERTVRLLSPGMLLDLGGIAKGYAADEMLAVLRKNGITRALVAAGGDIAVGDPPPNSPGWVVDVAPLTKAKPEYSLRLANSAVSTSGDAEQFVVIGGVRYSHIVDPRTGLGVTGRRSVTVIAKHGIDSDPLTKAVMLLPPERALKLIDGIDGAAALIVKKTETGEEVTESSRLRGFLLKPR
jgi:thiamine biosynthesis lipoprotein